MQIHTSHPSGGNKGGGGGGVWGGVSLWFVSPGKKKKKFPSLSRLALHVLSDFLCVYVCPSRAEVAPGSCWVLMDAAAGIAVVQQRMTVSRWDDLGALCWLREGEHTIDFCTNTITPETWPTPSLRKPNANDCICAESVWPRWCCTWRWKVSAQSHNLCSYPRNTLSKCTVNLNIQQRRDMPGHSSVRSSLFSCPGASRCMTMQTIDLWHLSKCPWPCSLLVSFVGNSSSAATKERSGTHIRKRSTIWLTGTGTAESKLCHSRKFEFCGTPASLISN